MTIEELVPPRGKVSLLLQKIMMTNKVMMTKLRLFLQVMTSSLVPVLVVHIYGFRVKFHLGNASNLSVCLFFSVNCVFRHVLIDLKPCLHLIRCIPSQSNATIKLELLPLTDGIIVLDTLQIDVQGKGTYLLYFWTIFFLLISCLSIYM